MLDFSSFAKAREKILRFCLLFIIVTPQFEP
ncbi:hypothetical protein [Escherichia phage dw-ec]|nr:hypothetical protein [Escherichia phage BI-EHEC]UJQ43814.1 hypothetical protein [Escherichia phage dw-ec]